MASAAIDVNYILSIGGGGGIIILKVLHRHHATCGVGVEAGVAEGTRDPQIIGNVAIGVHRERRLFLLPRQSVMPIAIASVLCTALSHRGGAYPLTALLVPSVSIALLMVGMELEMVPIVNDITFVLPMEWKVLVQKILITYQIRVVLM